MEKQLPIKCGRFGQVTENTKKGAAVQKHAPLSLSIQREIEKHRLNIESEIDNSMGKLGFRTLLDRSGIRKEKGYTPISFLFVLMVLPFIKEGVRSLWTNEFYGRFLNAQKDSFYRFLNLCGFNWRKFITLLVNRVLAIVDRSPFNDRVLIVDDSVLPKTGKEMELVSYHYDREINRSAQLSHFLEVNLFEQKPCFRSFNPMFGPPSTERRQPIKN
jgi:hypothetical protein